MQSDPILQSALSILDQGNGLAKRRAEGQPLVSTREGSPIIDPAVIEALRSGLEPDQQMQRALIFALDLLAAGEPDNLRNTVNSEIQRVAGKLRQRYARAFKSSAYAVSA
ncbi:hypothetical protein [Roseobacter sp. A03A-229]